MMCGFLPPLCKQTHPAGVAETSPSTSAALVVLSSALGAKSQGVASLDLTPSSGKCPRNVVFKLKDKSTFDKKD